ncbi:MAG: YCF48-related protein [Vicinamibacterales bacterium]|nr:YCF48-related protein [Vicinamibacterales bacterium]
MPVLSGRLTQTPVPPGAAALALMVCLIPAAAAGQTGEARERAARAPLAASSLLLDAAARDGLVVAVGERGHILVSTDEGQSWRQSEVETRALLTGVFMHDGRLGWAVGHDEVIVRTRDGGLTWQRVHNAPERERPLLDVWFADARTGLAVGAYGGLLATRDGGDTWAPSTVHGGDDAHLNQIAAAADGTLFLAGEAGHLYRSDDRGATWQPLPSPYDGSFFGLLPRPDGSLIAFGLRGHLYRSADRGRSWTPIVTGTEETLTCALDLGSGRFVVGGMAGTLLWSEGEGAAVRKQDLPDRKAIVALAQAAPGTLLLFGEGGVRRIDIPR